jgi:hypothetical protein
VWYTRSVDSPEDPWGVYTKRMRLLRWTLLGGIPAAGAAAYLWSVVSLVVLIAWVAAVAVVATYAEMSPCPRCSKAFFRAGAFHNLFAKSCMHCGLPKWAQAEHAERPRGATASRG